MAAPAAAAPLKKTKKRTTFKPQLGAIAPPIAWLSADESITLLQRMKELLAPYKARVVSGLNAASRCVENNRALLWVVARPTVLRLVQHLPLLGAARRVPVLPLSVPSLSPALTHLPTCLAFAITVRSLLPLVN